MTIGGGGWVFGCKTAVVLLLAGLLAAACDSPGEETSRTVRPAHHTAQGFKNLYFKDPEKSLFGFLAMKYFGDTVWADHASRAREVPVRNLDPKSLRGTYREARISWLGHTTFLLQQAGVNILTDPIFSDRASPLSFMGPARYIRHVMDYRQLPKIHYVVISHNHYDHLDAATIDRLGNGPIYLVPLGLKSWFLDRGIRPERVRQLDWGDIAKFPKVTIQATPSQHWSARGLFDRRKTLWASWLITIQDRKYWFAGDTGYNPVLFKKIGKAAGGIDVAFIPIGGYGPRSFMAPFHVDPAGAIKIHRDLGAKLSIGMHWGTFPLTAEGPNDPVIELKKQLKAQGVAAKNFITMTVGATLRP